MSGRRRTTERLYSAEDQALDQISKEAEERIQARRQARAEAREIRLREIEKQQKEEEDRQKGYSETPKSLSSYSGSRRGSDDSVESDVSSKDSRDPKDKARELKGFKMMFDLEHDLTQKRRFRNQLREMEEKYRQAMVTNAQLDNTKTSHVFQLELLKEQMEEKEETLIEVQREYRDKCRDFDLLKRDFDGLTRETSGLKQMMEIKDKLLQDSGFVIVSSEEGELSLTKCSDMADNPVPIEGSLVVSEEAAEILKKTAGGSLDDKLKKILEEKKKLQDEIKTLTDQVEEEKVKKDNSSSKLPTMNGPDLQLYEIQKEASKQIHEYKLKLQKSEQEIANLEGTVNRLESQVKRFKYDAEEAERLEDELKTDRRRLQKELRECQNQIEELQNQNKYLNKRLEKIRQSRSALVNP